MFQGFNQGGQRAIGSIINLFIYYYYFYSIKTTFQPSHPTTSLGAVHYRRHEVANGRMSLPQRLPVTAKPPPHPLVVL